MSRKAKSTKYTHHANLLLSLTLSSRYLPRSEKQFDHRSIAQGVLEDILEKAEQIILTKQLIQQHAHSILYQLEDYNQEYLSLSRYSSFVLETAICECQPPSIAAPEAQGLKKHNQTTQQRQPQSINKRFSKQKINSCDFEDFHKSLQRCKKDRELKRHCSNGNFVPLQPPTMRVSEDNNEQIQHLLRRKKELILQVRKDSRSKLKTKLVATQRKDKKYYFHHDNGQACEISLSDPLGKAHRLVPVFMKVQQGQTIATNLKKKAIVEFTSANKKSRRRIDRHLEDTCVLIEQIKQNDISLESAINRAHCDLKTAKLKTEEEWIPSAVKLPAVR